LSLLLPLFPLDVVLFPGASLPLHIFEPRYQEMIGECLAEKKRFGVVREREKGISEVGCAAEIVAVTHQYDDGRMDILTEGRERFQVLNLNRERAFLQGEVLYFEDGPEAAPAEQISRALELHGEVLGLGGATKGAPGREDPQLSFHLAASLPLDLDFKEAMLGLRSEVERMQALIACYEAILPNLRHAAHAREKAGGNGHVHGS
jgi:Lon protease-like protein